VYSREAKEIARAEEGRRIRAVDFSPRGLEMDESFEDCWKDCTSTVQQIRVVATLRDLRWSNA